MHKAFSQGWAAAAAALLSCLSAACVACERSIRLTFDLAALLVTDGGGKVEQIREVTTTSFVFRMCFSSSIAEAKMVF